jgi:hypothetical protein
MAHTYPGVDEPSSIIPVSPTAGYGVFPLPTVTDDQDNRDAASANLAAEADTDRINFLAWRMLNIIEGGIYGFAATVSTLNAWIFRGSATFRSGASLHMDSGSTTLQYGDEIIKSGGTITADSGSTVTTNGSLAVNGNTVIGSTASVLRNCFERRTGTGAWNGSRVQTGSNATVPAFDASAADATRCPSLTASRDYTLIDPGGSTAMGVEHTFERTIAGSNAFDWNIVDGPSNITLAKLQSGTNTRAFVKVRWNGANWYADSWGLYNGANSYVTL